MALTDERIAELRDEACKIAPLHRSAATPFARAVEAEVRGQDETLILQMMKALECCYDVAENPCGGITTQGTAILAARARLENGTPPIPQ